MVPLHYFPFSPALFFLLSISCLTSAPFSPALLPTPVGCAPCSRCCLCPQLALGLCCRWWQDQKPSIPGPTSPKALCPWPDRTKSPLSLVLSAGRPKQAEAGSGGVPRKSLTKQTTWLEWMWAELGILTQA